MQTNDLGDTWKFDDNFNNKINTKNILFLEVHSFIHLVK